jgi:glycosyltransferase involved in cell wall biosynthesis
VTGLPPLISFVLHKFSRGGSDRVAAYLAKGFVEAGFRVELVVFAQGGEVEQVLLDILGDVPVNFIGKAGRWRAADLLLGLPAFVRRLRRTPPDVILSTANNTALISAIGRSAARLRQALLVLKTTNPIATSRHRGLIRRLRLWSYRWVFRRTHAVWTLSDEESAEMRTEFPKFRHLFRAVAQPYVTSAMQRVRAAQSPSPNPIVLSIGRLTEQKRLDRLIEAFAHVQTSNARLLILGEGEDRDALEALVRDLGLTERVDMPGYLPDVALALQKASLFVLTSDYEGLPAAVIEAMAANCPVLSTDCFPSARSLIGRSDGCAIIEDASPAAIANQIDNALRQMRPTELVQIANAYSVANGITSHAMALSTLLDQYRSRDKVKESNPSGALASVGK